MALQDIKPLIIGDPKLDLPELDNAFRRVDENFRDRASAGDMTTAQANITTLQGKVIDESEIVLNTTNNYGTVATCTRRWTNIERNVGTAMTLTQSADPAPGLGDYITINTKGVYGLHYCDNFDSTQQFGVSVNANGATAFHLLAQANILIRGFQEVNSQGASVGGVRVLNVGDVIRAHTQGTDEDTDTRSKFAIVLIAKL